MAATITVQAIFKRKKKIYTKSNCIPRQVTLIKFEKKYMTESQLKCCCKCFILYAGNWFRESYSNSAPYFWAFSCHFLGPVLHLKLQKYNNLSSSLYRRLEARSNSESGFSSLEPHKIFPPWGIKCFLQPRSCLDSPLYLVYPKRQRRHFYWFMQMTGLLHVHLTLPQYLINVAVCFGHKRCWESIAINARTSKTLQLMVFLEERRTWL